MTTSALSQRIADSFLPDPPKSIGVAVSGGSDSLALLYLLHDFARAHHIALSVATVDHGLRSEAAAEANSVAEICAALGVPHTVLTWVGWDARGNLQDEARKERYRLLAQWGRAQGLDLVALGHTADDMAETFVMRLGRRAGVDGLAAIAPQFERNQMRWARPLLSSRRTELQEYLDARNVTWVNDPSNDDDKYTRVRVRKALAVLSELGVDSMALADVAENLKSARDALAHHMLMTARQIAICQTGAVSVDEQAFQTLPSETKRRLVCHALKWVNNAPYSPRSSALRDVFSMLESAPAATIQGCMIRRKGQKLWIFRELNAANSHEASVLDLWDSRWRVVPPPDWTSDLDLLTIRALGPEGLAHCPGWRDIGVPRGVLLASPAVWNRSQLVAAPLAGWAQNWQAVPERGEDVFFATHITH